MNLIPVTIQDVKDSSVINVPNTLNEIRLTFNVEVVSTGDFSDFLKDGKVDVDKLIVAFFKGDVYISTRLKQ